MPPAWIPCDPLILEDIYRRQFRELRELRRHILSLLPLRKARSIFEPGCGPGLLAEEIRSLTDAEYTGMDIQRELLPGKKGFLPGDAEANPLPADIYVTSFFFSSLRSPAGWLHKAKNNLSPGGLFAVFAEYDYSTLRTAGGSALSDELLRSLEESGLHTEHGERLDWYFEASGFGKLHGGAVTGDPSPPDRRFLSLHLDKLPRRLPAMKWRIVWGIWRKRSG